MPGVFSFACFVFPNKKQEAQQERSTFVSSLVPVIAEYFSPPPVADAQNIVSNLKVKWFCLFL